MNGIQSRKSYTTEKPVPGCLGRMVNLLDLSSGVAGNKMLTDKPHRDGSSLSRSRSDVARTWSPLGDQIEDKLIVSDSRFSSSKKANGTPMKMLIDQEMSKEGDSKHRPPNVVAKLMGLDAFPHVQPDSAAQRNHARGYSQRSLSHSGIPLGSWQQEEGFSDKGMQCEVYQSPEQNEYKDVYEMQSEKTNCRRDKSPQKGRHNDNINEKKMEEVRQSFMEAKRRSTDERLRQSKEFHDALEVLCSNKDLLLKVWQEPNSLISQHLKSIPPPPETKRITVLRPSKMVDNDKFVGSGKKNDKQIKKPAKVNQAVMWDKGDPGYSPSSVNQKVDESPFQPTRIVVLKPSPGKSQDIKAVVSSPSLSPKILHGESFYEEAEDTEILESREMAKEITRQMRENLMGHRRDETLLSSVFSNGYTGDESSFNKSETEYAAGNLSDSEVMSPSSRHSWDYINRFGSPYSTSSFSRASCSPESSVCREAKKRLFERWAMMASHGTSQEQRHARRSSSTLGEMLALSETKKSVGSEDKDDNKEQDPRESVSCVANNLNEEGVVDSPKNLLRSKSVPESSTVYGARLNVEVSDIEVVKMHVPKELSKAKGMKSSFKGKVSSLFFSRNKKSSKDKCAASQTKDEANFASPETTASPLHPHGVISDDASQRVNDGRLCPDPHVSSGKSSPDLTRMGQKHGIASCEAGFSVTKPGNVSENQDQPSPISVLEPPFEDDNATLESSGRLLPIKSNLIDKSPPIESMSRTLSWDDACAETATPYTLKPSVSPGTEEEEQDWLGLVQTLLSVAGLEDEVQLESFSARWHSLESPLDPSLRDKYATLHDKELLHEAKRRQWRSNRKLVYDCVNAALMEITGYGCLMGRPCNGANSRVLEGASPMLADRVWAQIKDWYSNEGRCFLGDVGECNNHQERMVTKEVVGKGWNELMRLEIDNYGKEIEGKLLEELVEEAVIDLTGRV